MQASATSDLKFCLSFSKARGEASEVFESGEAFATLIYTGRTYFKRQTFSKKISTASRICGIGRGIASSRESDGGLGW